MKSTVKKMSVKTKKLLISTLIVFVLSVIFFLWVMMHYRITMDLVWVIFFLYGALYAGWFRLCTQIAHKLKSLKLGAILFLSVLILALVGFWMFAVWYKTSL